MEKRDPFDELLMKCIEDGNRKTVEGKSVEGTVTRNLVNCRSCNEMILENYRYCPNCGETTVENSGDSSKGFAPLVMQKKLFRTTLLDLDRDFTFNGDYYTNAKIKIENMTEERLHVSLTFVDSVIINSSGRQFCPVDADEVDVPGLFEPWFFLYPRAYREGRIIFPEVSERIKSVYICCNPQNTDEEELFHFVIEP